MVMLEAMSVGLPLISFDCQCGPRDIINTCDNGLLVKEGDVQGLINAIIQVIENQSLRLKLGANSLANTSRFNRDSVMRKWVELFNSLI